MSTSKESTGDTTVTNNTDGASEDHNRRKKMEYQTAKKKRHSKSRQQIFDEVLYTIEDMMEVMEEHTRITRSYGDRKVDKLSGQLRVLMARMRKRVSELMNKWDFSDKDLSEEVVHVKEHLKTYEHKSEIMKKEIENLRAEVKKWKTDYIALQKQSESFMNNKGRLENEIVLQKSENVKLRQKLGRQDLTIRSILLARRNQRMAYKPENDDGSEKLITNDPRRITSTNIKDIKLPTDYDETHYTNHEIYDQGRADVGDTKKWLESLLHFGEDHRRMIHQNKFDDIFLTSPLKWIKISCCFYGKVVELYQRGTLIKAKNQEEDSVLYSRYIDMPPSKGHTRGYVLIINNTHFYEGVNKVFNPANSRPGASEEAVGLMKFFNSRAYHIYFYWNITAEEMVRAMYLFKNLDHTVTSSAICCIASRGEKNKVFGCDSKNVNIKDMIKLMHGANTKETRPKPKAFLMEVCKPSMRSSEQPDNIALEKVRVKTNMGKDNFQVFIPEMSEVLVAYSSETSGFPSPDPEVTPETIYFTNLVKNLTEYHKTEDITLILIRVHDALRKMVVDIDGKSVHPYATFECSLTKPLYF